MGTETAGKYLLKTWRYVKFMRDKVRPESRLTRGTGIRYRHPVRTLPSGFDGLVFR
jgi:hypothetical protein